MPVLARRPVFWFALLGLVTSLPVYAAAKSADAAGAGTGGASVSAEVGDPADAKQDPVVATDKSLGKLEQTRGVVQRQLGVAREQRLVVRTMCLDENLSQIDVTAKSMKEHRDAIRAAVKGSNRELINHEATMLGVLRGRGDQLVAKATGCVGEEWAFVGKTDVRSTSDRTLPDTQESTGAPSTDVTLISGPPIYTSATF